MTARTLSIGLMIGLGLASGGCESSPSRTSPVVLSPMTIDAGGSIPEPGRTAQMTARLRMPDGTWRDVTEQARWQVADPSVASIRTPGLVEGLRYGKTNVTATYDGSVAGATVRVVPEGGFLLTATVASFDVASRREPFTRLEAVSALGMYSVVSNAKDLYVLPASGDTVLRVERPGLPPAETTVAVGSDQSLEVYVPRPDAGGMTGTYTLTFTAADSCASRGPWVYRADVEERQGSLTVLVQGSDFISFSQVGFTGLRRESAVQFTISGDLFSPLCLIDGMMRYAGTATGTATDRGAVSAFEGSIGSCWAREHRMELVRLR